LPGINCFFSNTGPTSVKQDYIQVDKTLTKNNSAADAKTVGNKIKDLEDKVGNESVSSQIENYINAPRDFVILTD
jgi:hypothetical protein